jgi:hypothetical protein
VVEGLGLLPENHGSRVDVNLLVVGRVVLENLGRHVSDLRFRVYDLGFRFDAHKRANHVTNYSRTRKSRDKLQPDAQIT